MYLQHFGLSQFPFTIAPNPALLFPAQGHKEALAHLQYAYSGHGGLICLTGEVGTGKTTLCRAFIEQVPEQTRVAYIFNPHLSALELLQAICDELQLQYQPDDSYKTLHNLLNQALLDCYRRGERVICLIDEAQAMSPPLLEQIRLLTNLETDHEKLLTLILVGQPELNDLLARHDLRQLNQRITARYHLQQLSLAETQAYVDYRLKVCAASDAADDTSPLANNSAENAVFDPQATQWIWQRTAGVPRLINSVADRALLGAYALGVMCVDQAIAEQACNEVLGVELSAELGAELGSGPGSGKSAAKSLAGQSVNGRAAQQTTIGQLSTGWAMGLSGAIGALVGVAVLLLLSFMINQSWFENLTDDDINLAGGTQLEHQSKTSSEVSADLPRADVPNSAGNTAKNNESRAAAATSISPVAQLARLSGFSVQNCEQLIDAQCLWLDWPLAALQKLQDFSGFNQPILVQALDRNTGRMQWLELSMLVQQRGQSSSALYRYQRNALLFWQPPKGFGQSSDALLRPGQSSELVSWLRQQLLTLNGHDNPRVQALLASSWQMIRPSTEQASKSESTSDNSGSHFYDPLLANEVARFQRNHGLSADRIVGPQTLLYLMAQQRPEPTITSESVVVDDAVSTGEVQ